MQGDFSINLSKYVKSSFTSNAIMINSMAVLYYLLPIRIELYLGIVTLGILFLNILAGYRIASLNLIDANDCSIMLMQKINIEFIKFNWLINKFTRECFQYTIIALFVFYGIDRYIAPSLSFWIAFNFINLYLSFTKHAKNVVKYHLGLYKEYNKYVIHIIEPNAQDDKDEDDQGTFEEIIEEMKQI